MIVIEMRDGLPYVEIKVFHGSTSVTLKNVLLDTGSYRTLLATDSVSGIGLRPELTDAVQEIYGVGGSEFVIEKRVSRLQLGNRQVDDFLIELGEMTYGITLDGILGVDFLLAVGAIIDLDQMRLTYKT